MVPGGRILHAIGNLNTVTALNFYVLPALHNSLGGGSQRGRTPVL